MDCIVNVCDDEWGSADANVACRQLGFSPTGLLHACNFILSKYLHCFKMFPTGATAVSRALFGQGTGAILLDDVRCTGSETRLVDCPSNGIGIHDCAHTEDAGIICESKQLVPLLFIVVPVGLLGKVFIAAYGYLTNPYAFSIKFFIDQRKKECNHLHNMLADHIQENLPSVTGPFSGFCAWAWVRGYPTAWSSHVMCVNWNKVQATHLHYMGSF